MMRRQTGRDRLCPSSVQVPAGETANEPSISGAGAAVHREMEDDTVVVVVCVCSGCLQQTEVAVCLASLPAALLHRPQLLQTTLGELVHALLRLLHPVDRRLLLHHGLDGETRHFSVNTVHI